MNNSNSSWQQFFLKTKQLAWLLVAFCFINLGMNSTSPASAHIIKTSSWKLNGLTFTKKSSNWHGEDRGSIEVRRKGKLLLRRQAHDLWLWTVKNGDFVEAEDGKELRIVDLNADGIEDFIIRQWSGGAYCCYTYEVFSTKDCSRIWFDDAKYAHLKVLIPNANSAKNQPAVLAIEDGSFLCWRAHTLDGPRPIVYLTWKTNTSRAERKGPGVKPGLQSVDVKLARQSIGSVPSKSSAQTPLTAPILDRKRMMRPIDQIKFSRMKNELLSTEKEAMFIDLVYSGHSDAALSLIDNITEPDRKEFINSFVTALKSGPFYYKIAALNGLKFAKLTKQAKQG